MTGLLNMYADHSPIAPFSCCGKVCCCRTHCAAVCLSQLSRSTLPCGTAVCYAILPSARRKTTQGAPALFPALPPRCPACAVLPCLAALPCSVLPYPAQPWPVLPCPVLPHLMVQGRVLACPAVRVLSHAVLVPGMCCAYCPVSAVPCLLCCACCEFTSHALTRLGLDVQASKQSCCHAMPRSSACLG